MSLVETAPVQQRTRDLLATLDGAGPNLTSDDGPFDGDHGWKVDDRCTPLPDEAPGPPEDDGPWQAGRRVLEEYGMAPPSIVRAVFDADRPLEGRPLALEGRFAWLRFPMGVRIGSVTDDETEVGGRRVRRFGWSYTTLAGHLERGRMDWEVWKWLDTGQVQFRIHAFSQRSDEANPIVALGNAVFGRWTQERFYRQVLTRMRSLVEADTGRATTTMRCPDVPNRPLAGRLALPERHDATSGSAAQPVVDVRSAGLQTPAMDTTMPSAPPPEAMLRVVRVIAPIATLAMLAAVVLGLATAPDGAAAELFGNVWGRVTLVDLYLAFGALWVWIAWRERSAARATLWAVLIIVTGSVAIWGYVWWRAATARDMGELLLGPADIGA